MFIIILLSVLARRWGNLVCLQDGISTLITSLQQNRLLFNILISSKSYFIFLLELSSLQLPYQLVLQFSLFRDIFSSLILSFICLLLFLSYLFSSFFQCLYIQLIFLDYLRHSRNFRPFILISNYGIKYTASI